MEPQNDQPPAPAPVPPPAPVPEAPPPAGGSQAPKGKMTWMVIGVVALVVVVVLWMMLK